MTETENTRFYNLSLCEFFSLNRLWAPEREGLWHFYIFVSHQLVPMEYKEVLKKKDKIHK